MNKLGLFGLFILLVSAFVMAGTSWSSVGITRARTPWGSINSGVSLGHSSNSSAALKASSGNSISYAGNSCKLNKTGKSIAFKGKMACRVLPNDAFANEWSCLQDAKTIRCKGSKCPYSQCGVMGR